MLMLISTAFRLLRPYDYIVHRSNASIWPIVCRPGGFGLSPIFLWIKARNNSIFVTRFACIFESRLGILFDKCLCFLVC